MKLTRALIENYRSIHKLDIPIEGDITTFVGANEHGKSNILFALRMLAPKEEFDLKHDARIDSTGEQHNPSVKFYFDIESNDKKQILERLQKKFPPQTIRNADGTTTENPPQKEFKQKDIPDKVEYTRNFDDEEKPSHILNITNDDVRSAVYEYIKSEVGNSVIYFDDFQDRLESIIPKESITNSEDDLIIQGLLKVGGLAGMEEKIFTDDVQAGILLEKAPEKITKAVKQAWFQGNSDDIEIKIRKDNSGNNLLVNVEDKNTYVEFGARSRGFKWFLSFFLKYRAHHDGDLKDSIFLMDEPGLFLHPKGQKDLMSYIENLGKKNQILYATHSPFMINRLHSRRVRVVEKQQKKGTLINSKGYTANWRHMRTALGMVLSDSFYFADKTLLVEGPEDVIYVLALLKYFVEKEKMNVDVNLLSVMDAGGGSNLPAMARIVSDEERPLIALIDSDSQKAFNRLSKIIDTKKDLKEIKNLNEEAVTIQDLLPKSIYQEAVNNYLKKLVSDELINLQEGKAADYKIGAKSKLDKDVEKFVQENYGETDVSKVGIAREFEELLYAEKSISDKELASSKVLVEWVIKSLNLEIK